MGHTPGPWRLHNWGGDFTGEDTIDVLAADDLEVCALSPTYDDNGQPERPRATILANARLIAAAPSLLWAVKICLNMLDDHCDRVWFASDEHVNLDYAREAIAKAEGRSE